MRVTPDHPFVFSRSLFRSPSTFNFFLRRNTGKKRIGSSFFILIFPLINQPTFPSHINLRPSYGCSNKRRTNRRRRGFSSAKTSSKIFFTPPPGSISLINSNLWATVFSTCLFVIHIRGLYDRLRNHLLTALVNSFSTLLFSVFKEPQTSLPLNLPLPLYLIISSLSFLFERVPIVGNERYSLDQPPYRSSTIPSSRN